MKRTTIIPSILLILLAIACSMNDNGSSDSSMGGSSGTGQGGSMACFTIIGDHLYTIGSSNHLMVANISNPANPVFKKKFSPGFGIETVFPRGNQLFIGSQNGMYIYDTSNAENPEMLSSYSHIYSCDPVVADDQYAYITLNSVWGNCGRGTNELQIVDISNLRNPKLIYNKAMNSPRGLSIHNDTLVVCDNGLKVFEVAEDRKSITLLTELNIAATDVISIGNHLLVIGSDGFYLFFSNMNVRKIR